jgi:hypothetical protein
MAIARNVRWENGGEPSERILPGGLRPREPIEPPVVELPPILPPPPPPMPPSPPPGVPAGTPLPLPLPQPLPFPFPFPLPTPLPPVPKTATQLAQGAAAQLRAADRAVLDEAVTTVRNSRVSPDGLMYHLERKVLVGEVLNRLAGAWAPETRQDFAAAFSMSTDRTAVMDAIVSLAILNDPDLERELRAENLPPPTQDDLIENRRVAAQYPPAGTVVQQPYLILVAVEHQDTAQAEQVVRSIVGDLAEVQGFKLPSAAADKLRAPA